MNFSLSNTIWYYGINSKVFTIIQICYYISGILGPLKLKAIIEFQWDCYDTDVALKIIIYFRKI